MTREDEVDLFRRLEPRELELWPEFAPRGYQAPKLRAELAESLDSEAYYFALGEVQTHQVKRGPSRGLLKIDEVLSPVIHFQRSLADEGGELRSGYFWAELEARGDLSRLGGKPPGFHRLVRDLQEILKARYRKSRP